MFSAETLSYLRVPLRIGFKALYVYQGYSSATWFTVFLTLGVQLSFLGWITAAPTQIVKSEITEIDEFGISEKTTEPQINRRLEWPRIRKASLVILFGAFNAAACYYLGYLFSTK